ncbi:hypothetical protein NQ317_010510 [Molorchus minor]|uniref:Caspase family p10 domain-containing protein n=1 Tax=Molorchus minor TaxID=1323400 RepID=A0ABQ9JMZ4_9CUCU|nr:hypothetical protein NQ317_010510 [Molorchus minor]
MDFEKEDIKHHIEQVSRVNHSEYTVFLLLFFPWYFNRNFTRRWIWKSSWDQLIADRVSNISRVGYLQGAPFSWYYAFRNSDHGSYYVTVLCDALEKLAFKMDILNILTIVNRQVAVGFTK